MEREPGFINWLEENWNYIVASIIFFAFIYYDTGLSKAESAGNEMLYLVTFLPSFVYFLIIHPLWKEN